MLNAVKMKAFKITPEDLAETTFFSKGVHKVLITGTEISETEDKRVYVEIAVEGAAGEEAKVRQWLHTPDSRRISLDTIRKIIVHNIADDAGKAALRQKFLTITNLNDLNSFLARMVGYQAWLKVEKSKTRTYTNKETGEVKPSIERSLYGYEPKVKPATNQPQAQPETAQPQTEAKPTPIAVEADEHGTAHYADIDAEQAPDLSEIPF